MSLRSFWGYKFFIINILLLLPVVTCSACVIHVKPDGNDSNDGLSWETARKTIQAGIDAAIYGDQVWVKGDPDNHYYEQIILKNGVALYGGFMGTEHSLDDRPQFPRPVNDEYEAALDGEGLEGRIVTIEQYADSTTIIDGFSIINGWSYNGGGILCADGSPTISNNIIRNNGGSMDHEGGGGIYCQGGAPRIIDNVISNNAAYGDYDIGGGGIYCNGGSPVIRHNIIKHNSVDCYFQGFGGGIYCTGSALVVENIIAENNICGPSYRSYGSGGGIFAADCSVIAGNIIDGNSSNDGGGLFATDQVVVTNNTIVGNWMSGITCYRSPTISNNIVAFNLQGIVGSDLLLRNNCVYGNTKGDYLGSSPGEGDFSLDPQLVTKTYGNLHIQPYSPCIDKAWQDAAGIPVVDIDGQARIYGEGLDIGADETCGEVWPATLTIIRVKSEGNDDLDGSSWEKAKRTLQAAIDAVGQGGEIWAAAGIYYENINIPVFVHIYGGFNRTEQVRSQRNWVLNKTILYGRVSMLNSGYLLSSIDGFTIRNGGITCANSSPTIRNNVITSNFGHTGIGINCRYGSAMILDNIIHGLRQGICCYVGSSPLISGNMIYDNSYQYRGAGIYCDWACSPTISGNIISNNIADLGGGFCCDNYCSPVLINNRITNNTALCGGGIYCDGTEVFIKIIGNLIAYNLAFENGGAVYSSCSSFTSNTLIANEARMNGGGIYCDWCIPSMSNNIIAFGSSGIYVNGYDSVFLSPGNNCVYGNRNYDYSGVGPGQGDIQVDPQFINWQEGDYHLSAGSPCINAGWNDDPDMYLFDMDNQGRICQWTIDIGADEFWSSAMSIADTKAAPDDAVISGNGAVVSTAFDDCFYIESEDRSAGIRVEMMNHGIVKGMEVDISGKIATNASGEKCITAEAVFPQGSGQIDPVGMCGRSIGGSDWHLNTKTGVGQRGIMGALGLNNIGLLITTWGRVTDSGRGWFYLDDGSGVEDGTGTVGIYVDAEGMIVPAVGTSVIVTGVSSCEYYLGNLVNVLLVRRQNDILVLESGSANMDQSTSENPSPRHIQSRIPLEK